MCSDMLASATLLFPNGFPRSCVRTLQLPSESHVFYLPSAQVQTAHAESDKNEWIWSDSGLEVRSGHAEAQWLKFANH